MLQACFKTDFREPMQVRPAKIISTDMSLLDWRLFPYIVGSPLEISSKREDDISQTVKS
jgi:hypothetical protein